MAEKASVFRRSGRNVEAHYWAEEITGTARGRTKQGRKQRYKKKVDIKISRCSAGGSAPALGAGCRRFESCHLDHNPFKPHCYAVYFFTDRFLTVLFQKFCWVYLQHVLLPADIDENMCSKSSQHCYDLTALLSPVYWCLRLQEEMRGCAVTV